MAYPKEFLAATRFTLGPSIEGGYVYDKDDAGGETNHGITDKQDGKVDHMVDINRDGKGDVAVKDLTLDQSLEVYYRWYWSGLCEKLDPVYAAFLFDCSVNNGYSRAKEWKKQCLDLMSLIRCREQFFKDCVVHRPLNKKYINGWLNRIDAFCLSFNVKYKTKR